MSTRATAVSNHAGSPNCRTRPQFCVSTQRANGITSGRSARTIATALTPATLKFRASRRSFGSTDRRNGLRRSSQLSRSTVPAPRTPAIHGGTGLVSIRPFYVGCMKQAVVHSIRNDSQRRTEATATRPAAGQHNTPEITAWNHRNISVGHGFNGARNHASDRPDPSSPRPAAERLPF